MPGHHVPQPVTDLTESSEEQVPVPRGRKRKRLEVSEPRKRRLALTDDVGIQLLLRKKCSAGCTRRCKEVFLDRQRLSDFHSFRKEWSGYHKVDQDLIEA